MAPAAEILACLSPPEIPLPRPEDVDLRYLEDLVDSYARVSKEMAWADLMGSFQAMADEEHGKYLRKEEANLDKEVIALGVIKLEEFTKARLADVIEKQDLRARQMVWKEKDRTGLRNLLGFKSLRAASDR